MKQNENEIRKEKISSAEEIEAFEEPKTEASPENEPRKAPQKESENEKTAGDKFMLTIGGAGIVVVVAAIVFLLSLSFGSKGDEETTAPSTTAVSMQSATESVSINYVESTEGITEVQDVAIDSSCRDAVKVFTDCFIYGNTANAKDMLPDSVWDSMAQSFGVSRDEFITVVQSNFAINSVASKIGEENVLACDVTNVLVIEDSAAAEIRAAISQNYGIEDSSITDVYAVSMVM